MDFTINFYGGFYREKLLKSVAFPFAKWSMNAGFPYLYWFGLSKTILGRQSMMTGHKTHIRGYIISVFRYKHRFLALFFMRSFIPTTDWWRDTLRQCGESPAFCWWNLLILCWLKPLLYAGVVGYIPSMVCWLILPTTLLVESPDKIDTSWWWLSVLSAFWW